MTPTPVRPPSDPPSRGWAATGALLAGLGVALGAFGAHALEPLLNESRLGTYQTAVRYQTHQALGLILLALLPARARVAAPFLLAGTLLFSGALYLLVALDAPLFGAVAPIGGAAMILGWLLAAWRLLRG
jgi:uncharacterized membrane protein YgdD (TMEM256/DUF423 family)